MMASSDTRSRDNAPDGCDSSWADTGLKQARSRTVTGDGWPQLPEEQSGLRWPLQSCRSDLRTAVGHITAQPGAGEDNSWAGNQPKECCIRNPGAPNAFA